jgi:hypothetical protein
MSAPGGASVYTLKRHRSTFILLRHASAPFSWQADHAVSKSCPSTGQFV